MSNVPVITSSETRPLSFGRDVARNVSTVGITHKKLPDYNIICFTRTSFRSVIGSRILNRQVIIGRIKVPKHDCADINQRNEYGYKSNYTFSSQIIAIKSYLILYAIKLSP